MGNEKIKINVQEKQLLLLALYRFVAAENGIPPAAGSKQMADNVYRRILATHCTQEEEADQ